MESDESHTYRAWFKELNKNVNKIPPKYETIRELPYDICLAFIVFDLLKILLFFFLYFTCYNI